MQINKEIQIPKWKRKASSSDFNKLPNKNFLQVFFTATCAETSSHSRPNTGVPRKIYL